MPTRIRMNNLFGETFFLLLLIPFSLLDFSVLFIRWGKGVSGIFDHWFGFLNPRTYLMDLLEELCLDKFFASFDDDDWCATLKTLGSLCEWEEFYGL